MNSPHKIHVKIGDSEFTAEGSESTVQSQYDAFLDAIKASRPSERSLKQRSPEKDDEHVQEDETALVQRVFLDDKRGGVSLKVLPAGDKAVADALLLILYGYRVLRGEDTLTAIQLGKSGDQSGCSFERADRIFKTAGYDDLVSKTGQRAGTKYGLKNPGVTKAKQLLQEVLG